MCAFIDELVDAFGDEVDLGQGMGKNLHPYLPKASSVAVDETLHDKLVVKEKAVLPQATNVAPAEMALTSSKPSTYLPSPSGKHHSYLPSPKKSEQASDEHPFFAKSVDVDSDEHPFFAKSVDVEEDCAVAAAAEDEVKPFRLPRNSSVHSYLCRSSTTSEDDSMASPADTCAKEDHECEVQNAVDGNEDSPTEKLDIDAMLAALPPKTEKIAEGNSFMKTEYANPLAVLQANPELHCRMTSFLCHDIVARSWPRCDFTNGMQFNVPVR
jgi:hypothetical protein